MNMRSIAVFIGFILGAALLAAGQETPASFAQHGDVALTYDWVHTNAQPGDCGCFGLNGGGISSSINFRPRWSVVADIVAAAGNSLTLSSYQGGLRYRISQPWMKGPHPLQPFAQALFGGAHSSGQVAGAANGSTSFAFRIGGGVDLPINARFAVRVIQADYYLTLAKNGVNDHQNNLLLGAGIVYRWSRQP
jgi:outer membrane immunogenic protein